MYHVVAPLLTVPGAPWRIYDKFKGFVDKKKIIKTTQKPIL